MADHVSSDSAAVSAAEGGALSEAAGGPAPTSFHGRAVSWVSVSIVMAGFVVGGIGLVLGPLWWLFWVGVGMSGVGGLLALSTNIFDDWY